jgi:hypothetical protein
MQDWLHVLNEEIMLQFLPDNGGLNIGKLFDTFWPFFRNISGANPTKRELQRQRCKILQHHECFILL